MDIPQRGWSAAQWVIVALVLLASAGLGWHLRAPEVTTGGDEATQVILAESLRHGRYHSEFMPGAPPHTMYPPGQAAWLAMISVVAGPGPTPVRIASIGLLMLTALLVGDGLRRVAGAWAGILGLLATAWNERLLLIAGTGLPESLFMTGAVLACWAALRADDSRDRRLTILASAASLVSVMARLAGVTAVGAVGAWLLLRKRWRAAALHAAASGVVVGGWALHAALGRRESVLSYANDLERVGQRHGLLPQVLENAVAYLRIAVGEVLTVPTVPGTALDNVAALLLLAGCAAVGLPPFARRWPALALYLVSSVVMLLVWPYQLARLLSPVVPAAVALLLIGAAVLGRRLPGPGGNLLMAVVALGVTLPGLTRALGQPREYDWYQATLEATRGQLPAGTIVAATKPPVVYYFAGYQSTDLFTFVKGLTPGQPPFPSPSGAGVILLGRKHPAERERVAPPLERICLFLEVRLQLHPTVLLLGPRRAAAQGDACGALAAYRAAPPAGPPRWP